MLVTKDEVNPFVQVFTNFLTLQLLTMSFDEVISKFSVKVRVGVAIRKLYIVDFLAILLNPEIKILTVDQKLRKIKKLRDNFTYIGHLRSCVLIAVT